MSTRISPAVWKQTIERNGYTEIAEGLATDEPFSLLAERATQSEQMGTPSARVSLTLGSSAEYGSLKVSVTLSVPVSCNEPDISLAGEAVFIKAHQMLNEASASLGLPPVE